MNSIQYFAYTLFSRKTGTISIGITDNLIKRRIKIIWKDNPGWPGIFDRLVYLNGFPSARE